MWKSYVNRNFLVVVAMLGLPLVGAHAQGMGDAPDSSTTTTTTTYKTVTEQPNMSRSLGVLDSRDIRPMAADTPQTEVQVRPSAASQQTSDMSSGPLQPTVVGTAKYITGGIGEEERAQLDSVKGDYNLHILNASKSGEYLGDVMIVVIDRKGAELISSSSGPLFFASLPPGPYTVKSTTHGQSKEQKVSLGDRKPASLHFSW